MYATIEGKVSGGVVIPVEPSQMPSTGRVLIIILPGSEQKTVWGQCRSKAGWLNLQEDPAEWQNNVRAEWAGRL